MKTYLLIISFIVVNFYQLCQCKSQPLSESKTHNVEIKGGDYAKPGQFPFAVVLAEIVSATSYRCTGAIIHERWVLTGAGCFIQYKNEDVFAGALYWRDGTRYNITRWFIHPEYANAAQINDVGLAKIDGLFKFDQFIAPIKLGEPKADEAASVVSWGGDEVGFVENLKYANVTVLSYDECSLLVPNPNMSLVPGSICSLSSNEIGFYYDRGAPLIQNGVLVGIFSHVVNVGIYSNAAYYLDWIKQTMADNN